mgnify:CR=1 FL=1
MCANKHIHTSTPIKRPSKTDKQKVRVKPSVVQNRESDSFHTAPCENKLEKSNSEKEGEREEREREKAREVRS